MCKYNLSIKNLLKILVDCSKDLLAEPLFLMLISSKYKFHFCKIILKYTQLLNSQCQECWLCSLFLVCKHKILWQKKFFQWHAWPPESKLITNFSTLCLNAIWKQNIVFIFLFKSRGILCIVVYFEEFFHKFKSTKIFINKSRL